MAKRMVDTWTCDFKTTIHSLGNTVLYKNRLESPLTLKNGIGEITLENNGDDDQTRGRMKFCVESGKTVRMEDFPRPMDKAPPSLHGGGNTVRINEDFPLFKCLVNSMLLMGLILHDTKFGDPRCISCEPAYYSRSLPPTLIIIEDKTIISSDRAAQISNLFVRMKDEPKLMELVDEIMEIGTSQNIGSFFSAWTKFNKIYRPDPNHRGKSDIDMIRNYVDNLHDMKIKILHARNADLFTCLAEHNICSRYKRKNYSSSLRTAMNGGCEKEIVNHALKCVYELRNEIFHEGRTNFNHILDATSFVLDLVYLDVLVTGGYDIIGSRILLNCRNRISNLRLELSVC